MLAGGVEASSGQCGLVYRFDGLPVYRLTGEPFGENTGE
jgi:hypothetical protein